MASVAIAKRLGFPGRPGFGGLDWRAVFEGWARATAVRPCSVSGACALWLLQGRWQAGCHASSEGPTNLQNRVGVGVEGQVLWTRPHGPKSLPPTPLETNAL